MAIAVTTTYSSDPNVDGLLHHSKWAEMNITFSFPSSSSQYGSDYSAVEEPGRGFQTFNAAQRAAIRDIVAQIEGFMNLDFQELTESSSADATLRFGETSTVYDASSTSAWVYRPGRKGELAGDAWYNASGANSGYDTPALGTRSYATFMHQMGHQLGLKDPHQTNGGDVMADAYDNRNYTVMSHERISGGDVQTYMPLDIAALQHLYGADFTSNAGNSVYTWSATTGEMSINGTGTGRPATNVILRTIWDGGGTDTYDLSNYTTALKIDLNPGAFSTFRSQQITGSNGNLANSLLYKGDTRSLIENIKGGSGSDILTGNQAANRLDGGVGADTLKGGAGTDILKGGAGADIFVFRKEATYDVVTDPEAGDRYDISAWGLSAGELRLSYDAALNRSLAQGDDADEHVRFNGEVTASQFTGIGEASTPSVPTTPTPPPASSTAPAPVPVPVKTVGSAPVGKQTITVDYGDATLETFTYRPAGDIQGVLLNFHGSSRNASGARDAAVKIADKYGLYVVSPKFEEADFPSLEYQRGGLLSSGRLLPESTWTISLVDDIARWAHARVGNDPDHETIAFGHSAGGQFLSRVAAFGPDIFDKMIIANPSTHVRASLSEDLPYGFDGYLSSAQEEALLRDYLADPVTIYLGGDDNDPYAADLARGSAAMRQGDHRLERGQFVFNEAKQMAASKGWNFNWELVVADNVGHTPGGMFNAPEFHQAFDGRHIDSSIDLFV